VSNTASVVLVFLVAADMTLVGTSAVSGALGAFVIFGPGQT
jgi:hypothetical protein